MFWLLATLAYLLGSLSFAILLSRLTGNPDPRMSGSGNAGATNMLRLAGKKLADPDLARRSVQRPAARADRRPCRPFAARTGLDRRVRRHRPPVPAVLPLSRRQRCRHRCRHAAGAVPAGRAAGGLRLAADVLPDPHQLAGGADRHAADPATAGLAGTGGAAADERADTC